LLIFNKFNLRLFIVKSYLDEQNPKHSWQFEKRRN